MGKIAIIGDPHLGKKNTDKIKKDRILISQDAFYSSLFDYCSTNGIDEILWTGDIFDTQNSIETPIIEYAVKLFNNKLKNFKHHIVVGNHDIFLRDSLDISSLACLENLSNVTVYRAMKKVNINNLNILMVPFLVSDISPTFINNIEKIGSKCDVVFGHFDIIGAKMENGSASEVGLDMNLLLKNIKMVISGHYHNISSYKLVNNVIQYVGTPYQLTFGDAGQPRGFWTLDDKMNLEFIENTISATFVKTDIEDIENLPDISNSFVKCTYPSTITSEELFALNKILEDKRPISYATEPKQIENVSDLGLTTSKEDVVFNDMCDHLVVGDFMGVCDIYIGLEPPKNAKLVKELLLDIKKKVK